MRTVTTILILFISTCAYPQISEGSKQAGLSASPLVWVTSEQVQFQGIVLQGYYGKFINQKTSIGIQPYYVAISSKVIGANGYARFYPFNKKFIGFFEGSLGLGVITNDLSEFWSVFDFAVAAGGGYVFNKKFSLEIKLQYQQWKVFSEPGFARTIVPTFGLMYYFKR